MEARYEKIDFVDPAAEDEESSDIKLSTAEVAIDVDIFKHVKGHVAYLWEEDDTEPVDLDEGFIMIGGEDSVPLYLTAGKLYGHSDISKVILSAIRLPLNLGKQERALS